MIFKIASGKGVPKTAVSTHQRCAQQVRCALPEACR